MRNRETKRITELISVAALILILLSTGAAFAEEKLIEIQARKFSYTPNKIKVNKGDIVKIRLISEDVQHGFFLDGYGIETSAYPGKEGTLTFLADKTGRYSYRCSVTCGEFHPFMVGYLTVEPNSRFHIFLWLTLFIAAGSALLPIFRKKKESGNA